MHQTHGCLLDASRTRSETLAGIHSPRSARCAAARWSTGGDWHSSTSFAQAGRQAWQAWQSSSEHPTGSGHLRLVSATPHRTIHLSILCIITSWTSYLFGRRPFHSFSHSIDLRAWVGSWVGGVQQYRHRSGEVQSFTSSLSSAPTSRTAPLSTTLDCWTVNPHPHPHAHFLIHGLQDGGHTARKGEGGQAAVGKEEGEGTHAQCAVCSAPRAGSSVLTLNTTNDTVLHSSNPTGPGSRVKTATAS